MGGDKSVRSRGWTAVIVAVVVEAAVLGAVGIYASVAGGATFESRAWLKQALTPAPTSTATTPEKVGDEPEVEARPVEVDPCTLVAPEDINLQLGTTFQPDSAIAGPGAPGLWVEEDGWWATCSYEQQSDSYDVLDITVVTGPAIDLYRPDHIDSEPLSAREVPDDTPRAIPGLGDEAWIFAEEAGEAGIVSLGVEVGSAIVQLDYTSDRVVDLDGELAVVVSDALDRLPQAPKITPKRIGAACSEFDLTGAEKFAGTELAGAREQKSVSGDVTCGFAGIGSTIEVSLLTAANAREERAYFRASGHAVSGVGDEAYSAYVEVDEDWVMPYYFVRDGDRVFEVTYEVFDEDMYLPRTKPTAAEVALLRSLLADGDVITG